MNSFLSILFELISNELFLLIVIIRFIKLLSTLIFYKLVERNYLWVEMKGLNFRSVHTVWGLLDVYLKNKGKFFGSSERNIFILDNLDDD